MKNCARNEEKLQRNKTNTKKSDSCATLISIRLAWLWLYVAKWRRDKNLHIHLNQIMSSCKCLSHRSECPGFKVVVITYTRRCFHPFPLPMFGCLPASFSGHGRIQCNINTGMLCCNKRMRKYVALDFLTWIHQVEHGRRAKWERVRRAHDLASHTGE